MNYYVAGFDIRNTEGTLMGSVTEFIAGEFLVPEMVNSQARDFEKEVGLSVGSIIATPIFIGQVNKEFFDFQKRGETVHAAKGQ